MVKEIKSNWEKSRCRECGAGPEVRLTHVSGCLSGWPDDQELFEKLKSTTHA
jgi:hypothetical protein